MNWEIGRLQYSLGIEVAYSNQGIFTSQQKSLIDLLGETGKVGCRVVLRLKKESEVDKKTYQRLVGKLIYLAHTQPDIAH